MENLSLSDMSVVSLGEKIREKKENYEENKDEVAKISQGVSAAVILIFLLFFLIVGLWIWAIYALIHYWEYIPTWVKIVGIIGIIPIVPFGPILTLICVYATQKRVNWFLNV